MRWVNKRWLSLALSILVSGFVWTGYAQTNLFTDVSEEDWFYETVDWAVSHQLIQGYPDGTFQPGANITEAEFLALLFRLVNLEAVQFNIERHGGDIWKKRVMLALEQAKSPVEEGEYWAHQIYSASESLNLAVKEKSARNQPITRGEAAIMLAKLLSSQTFTEERAVQYLLDSGLSKGKLEATYAGFQAEAWLTRAEAITFLKRLDSPINRPQVSLH